MSDALTDIARDQERIGFFQHYLLRIKEYVLNPNPDTSKAVIEAAKTADFIRGGYWSSEIELSENIENRLKRLVSEDKIVKETEWAKLLGLAVKSFQFQELKALSPFANKTVVFVDYGRGFVNISGDLGLLKGLIAKAIRNQGMTTYDCDDYLVIMPPIEIKAEEIKAFWLNCGILGVNSPRNPNQS